MTGQSIPYGNRPSAARMAEAMKRAQTRTRSNPRVDTREVMSQDLFLSTSNASPSCVAGSDDAKLAAFAESLLGIRDHSVVMRYQTFQSMQLCPTRYAMTFEFI